MTNVQAQGVRDQINCRLGLYILVPAPETAKLMTMQPIWKTMGMTIVLLFIAQLALAQSDTVRHELKFTGDFRFRIEHDWNSRKSDGTYRDDRSRLRYRFRFGLNYRYNNWASFGARMRTGNLNDQQGPHITLGGNTGEFRLVQIGLEKLFFRFDFDHISGWIGKNSFPFSKQNELFWNDNVFPEGAAFSLFHSFEDLGIDEVNLHVAHFIIQSGNGNFGQDGYLEAVQLEAELWDRRVHLFPGFYYFNRLSNIPDGNGTYQIPYSILHLGGAVKIAKSPNIRLALEYYNNLQDYSEYDSIPSSLRNQCTGIVASIKFGQLKKKGDWLAELYLTELGKYSIVDYFAQNDWARWDYSGQGATGSRLSNFRGGELRLGYAFGPKFNLILRAYYIEQLVAVGAFKENGSRIRLDMNIGF